MSSLRYRYQTHEFGDHDIHFRSLKDRQQFQDIDGEAESMGVPPSYWPMFGVVWPSGEVLAQLMTDYDIKDRKILEIGCGVGLASLVLNKRMANITATDIHPCAESYMEFNSRLNDDRKIPFLRTAWEDVIDKDFGTFDLIIASDVLFERLHFERLSSFIEKVASSTCEVIVVEAGRGYGGKFTRRMESFGYAENELQRIEPFSSPEKYRGKIHRYSRTR